MGMPRCRWWMVRQGADQNLAFVIVVDHRSMDNGRVDDRLCLSSLWPSSMLSMVRR